MVIEQTPQIVLDKVDEVVKKEIKKHDKTPNKR
jgi:hypothetical protein